MAVSMLWDDDHISERMLGFHLDPTAEPASRPHAFIERSAECSGIAQRGPVVLANYVEDTLEHVRQIACGRQAAVDRGPRASRIHATSDDMLAGFAKEPRLDHRLIVVRTDLVLAGRLAATEPQGAEKECLARARLSGDHDEAGTRFEVGVRNQAEVVNRQLIKHGEGHAALGRCSGQGRLAWRSR